MRHGIVEEIKDYYKKSQTLVPAIDKPDIDFLNDGVTFTENQNPTINVKIGVRVALEYVSAFWRETAIGIVKSIKDNGNIWIVEDGTGLDIVTSIEAIRDKTHKLKLMEKVSLKSLRYKKSGKENNESNKKESNMETPNTESQVAALSSPVKRRGRPKGALWPEALAALKAQGLDPDTMTPEQRSEAAKALRKPAGGPERTVASNRGRPLGSYNTETQKALTKLGMDETKLREMSPSARRELIQKFRKEGKI
jgi:hypothetical protein